MLIRKKLIFRVFRMMLMGALCWHSELHLRRAASREVLAILIPRRALRQEELRGIRVQVGASWSTRPEKKMW